MTTQVEIVDEVVGTEPLLSARQVTMQFGGLTAVNKVDLDIHPGEIVGLIGPNGAGKTTFFNCLTGMYQPTSGQVLFAGEVLPPKPRKVAVAGVARTFQNIRLFHNMTALENVMVGRYARTKTNALDAILRLPRHRREEAETREVAQQWLDFVGLGESTDLLSRNMPYGDQRRLEIARALALEPKLLLLDEPAGDPRGRGTDHPDPRAGHGGAGDRARHAVHLQPVRPGGVPGAGRGPDRRRASGRPERPSGHRGVHRLAGRHARRRGRAAAPGQEHAGAVEAGAGVPTERDQPHRGASHQARRAQGCLR